MSVEHVGSQYVPVCDCCGCDLPPCASYALALMSMRRAEWRRHKSDMENAETGRHISDTCRECKVLEMGDGDA